MARSVNYLWRAAVAPRRRVEHLAISKLDLVPPWELDGVPLHEESSFRSIKLAGDLRGSPIKG